MKKEKEIPSVFNVAIPPSKVVGEFGDPLDEFNSKDSSDQLVYQHRTWFRLRDVIDELVEKAEPSNLDTTVANLFAENIIRGRGLFCTSCIKHQRKNPRKTIVYAALVALVNSKFPAVAELLFKRLFCHFGLLKDQNNMDLRNTLKFAAHLTNLRVIHGTFASDCLIFLLYRRTNKSVKLAVQFFKMLHIVFIDFSQVAVAFEGVRDHFKEILAESKLDKPVLVSVEMILNKWKSTFEFVQRKTIVPPLLDWVKRQVMTYYQKQHEYGRKPLTGREILLDKFKPDKLFLEHEKAYRIFRRQILLKGYWERLNFDCISYKWKKYFQHFGDNDFPPESCGEKLLQEIKKHGEMLFFMELLEDAIVGCYSEPHYEIIKYICGKDRQYEKLLGECFLVVWLMIPGLPGNLVYQAANVIAEIMTDNLVSLDALVYVWSQPQDMSVEQYRFLKHVCRALGEYWTESKLLEKLEESQELIQVLCPERDPTSTKNTRRFFDKAGLAIVAKGLLKQRRIPTAD